jgi:hypothetical protein
MQNHRRHNGTGATTGTTELTTQQRQQMNTVPTPPATSKNSPPQSSSSVNFFKLPPFLKAKKDVPAHRKKHNKNLILPLACSNTDLSQKIDRRRTGSFAFWLLLRRRRRRRIPHAAHHSSFFFFWAAALEWYNESFCEGKFVHL